MILPYYGASAKIVVVVIAAPRTKRHDLGTGRCSAAQGKRMGILILNLGNLIRMTIRPAFTLYTVHSEATKCVLYTRFTPNEINSSRLVTSHN